MSREERRTFIRWVELVILGKILGILAAVWIGGTVVSRAFALPISSAVVAAVAVMAVAGFVEGTVVGFAQAKALGNVVRGVRSGSWALTTGIATGLAWALAMRANIVMLQRDLAAEELLAVVIVLGSGLGVIVGAAQWLHLRKHLANPAGWIAANAVAWVMGTLAAAGFLSFLDPESSALEIVLLSLAAGVSVGVVVGAITGAALVGLTHDARAEHR